MWTHRFARRRTEIAVMRINRPGSSSLGSTLDATEKRSENFECEAYMRLPTYVMLLSTLNAAAQVATGPNF
jgi:hypothetical protein